MQKHDIDQTIVSRYSGLKGILLISRRSYSTIYVQDIDKVCSGSASIFIVPFTDIYSLLLC